MKEIIKPGMSLFVITVLAAMCLGVVYSITKDPIAREKEKTKILAMQEVLPSADEFSDYEGIPDGNDTITSVSIGYRNGNEEGYVVGVAPKGYGGAIEMLVGINMSGEVQGVRITGHNETPGLGANASSSAFTVQYNGKKGPFTVTKSTPGDNEIEAITSATITTGAVTKGVNDALAFFNTR